MGSGPAVYLAARHLGLGGLILESPFTSIEDAASGFPQFGIYPLRLLLHTHFDNLGRIGSVHAPVLIVSGTADTLTPAWMAKRIFERANSPKWFYAVRRAGHNDLLTTGGDALMAVLREFLQREP